MGSGALDQAGPQEVVNLRAGGLSLAIALLVACVIVLWGLRGIDDFNAK